MVIVGEIEAGVTFYNRVAGDYPGVFHTLAVVGIAEITEVVDAYAYTPINNVADISAEVYVVLVDIAAFTYYVRGVAGCLAGYIEAGILVGTGGVIIYDV